MRRPRRSGAFADQQSGTRPYSDEDPPVSTVVPRPPIVPSEGVMPMPLGLLIPLTLVPLRAELERDVLRPVAPVRRGLLDVLVVARAPVLPELLRPLLRLLELRRLAGLRVVLRDAGLRVVLREAGLRVLLLRDAGLRVVLRLAGLRAVALPPRAPSVLAAALTRPVLRLAGFRAVLREAGLRVVLRDAGLRVAGLRVAGLRVVLRDAGLRAAGLRVVLREAGLRAAGLRVVLREAGLRVVVRPDVDRRVVPPDERVLVPLDLLRAVAICSLLVGDVEGNADVGSMRVASADIQQELHLSYFEMSSTRSPVCASDALRAMSA
jgi:hypothetical protein